MKKVCILLVLITQEFAWCIQSVHLSLARMLHARGTYFLTGSRTLNPQKCGRKRGVTEESNAKSQALHVHIDSLYEQWQSDICCADWQKQFHHNHEHCRRHSCGTQPLLFPSHYKASSAYQSMNNVADWEELTVHVWTWKGVLNASSHLTVNTHTQTSQLWKQQETRDLLEHYAA
jgi:hypothetical protein